jgi:hypothetical protein
MRFLIVIVALTVASAAAAEPAMTVNADNGRLTVRARETPLVDVLQLIASRSGVGLAAAGDLDVRVTVDLDDVEIGEALRRLAEPGATVWIVEPGPTAPAATIVSQTHRSVGEFIPGGAAPMAAETSDARATERAATVLGALTTPQPAAAGIVALADPSASVRVHAAYALRQSEGVAAIPILAAVAISDPEPRVRLAAVRALSFLPGEDAARALALASRDPDAAVRREAARGLATIDRRPQAPR